MLSVFALLSAVIPPSVRNCIESTRQVRAREDVQASAPVTDGDIPALGAAISTETLRTLAVNGTTAIPVVPHRRERCRHF